LRVPQGRPKNRSAYGCPEKLPDSLSGAQSARNDAGKQDLEHDYRGPVIQQAFALNDDREAFVHCEVFENSKHGNRIGCGDDRAEE